MAIFRLLKAGGGSTLLGGDTLLGEAVSVTITGVLFTSVPVFPAGSISGSFWTDDPVGQTADKIIHTDNKVAHTASTVGHTDAKVGYTDRKSVV